LTVVGDDDQSIYGFQGANPKNFKHLAAAFPTVREVSADVPRAVFM